MGAVVCKERKGQGHAGREVAGSLLCLLEPQVNSYFRTGVSKQ